MKKLPEWLINLAKKNKCPRCGSDIDINNIMGVGMKESSTKKGKDIMFFEYFCTNCEDVFLFELNFAPTEDILASILGSEGDGDFEGKPVAKSGITDREVGELKKFLKGCKYFEDFLLEIGVPKSDIEKYGKKIDRKEK